MSVRTRFCTVQGALVFHVCDAHALKRPIALFITINDKGWGLQKGLDTFNETLLGTLFSLYNYMLAGCLATHSCKGEVAAFWSMAATGIRFHLYLTCKLSNILDNGLSVVL